MPQVIVVLLVAVVTILGLWWRHICRCHLCKSWVTTWQERRTIIPSPPGKEHLGGYVLQICHTRLCLDCGYERLERVRLCRAEENDFLAYEGRKPAV